MVDKEEKEKTLDMGPCGLGHGNVQRLNGRHYQIIDLVLLGKRAVDIAKIVGMTARSVGLVIHSPSFQHELSMRRDTINEQVNKNIVDNIDDTAEELKKAGLEAARKLIGGLASSDEGIVFRSAADILDRTGYPKMTKSIGALSTNIGIDEKSASLIAESLKMDKEK